MSALSAKHAYDVILYTGKYSPLSYLRPFHPCSQRVNLRLGKFQAKITWGENYHVYSKVVLLAKSLFVI